MITRQTRFNRLFGVAAVAVFLVTTVSAEEQKIYESLPEVVIGKVFFSSAEREQLEKYRSGTSTQGDSKSASVRTAHKKNDNDGAGFWTSSRGLSKVYSGGDFVASENRVEREFPGDVDVVRRREAEVDEAENVEK